VGLIWKKGGTSLATASPTSGIFTPTASQWRSDSISLAGLNGKANVQFALANVLINMAIHSMWITSIYSMPLLHATNL
jgi:hypothetical protein